jgi:Repeat of unknown function (DUF5648)
MCNGRRSAIAAVLAATVCTLPLRSVAEVDVLQLYSTLDGEYQAILLEDDENDAVDRFRGLTFVMHDVNGTSRSFTLTPDRVHEPAVVVDGKRRFLVATRQMSQGLRTQAELPDAFLETDGGTLAVFGGVSKRYPPFGHDDAIAFQHRVSTPVVSNFALAQHPIASLDGALADFFAKVPAAPIVREYFHAGLGHYFLAVSQREKADLDAGRRTGWERTGKYFRSLDDDNAYGVMTVPVCRYYLPPPLGDTHFFSAFADECEAVARLWPDAILETAEAFRVALPERTSGMCLPEISSDDPDASTVTVPVYRVWNGQPDTNHRYTRSFAEQSEMTRRGWIAEGYGTQGVAMCVDAFDFGVIEVPKQKPRTPRRDESR